VRSPKRQGKYLGCVPPGELRGAVKVKKTKPPYEKRSKASQDSDLMGRGSRKCPKGNKGTKIPDEKNPGAQG